MINIRLSVILFFILSNRGLSFSWQAKVMTPDEKTQIGLVNEIVNDARGVLYFSSDVNIIEYDGSDWRYLHEEKNIAAMDTSEDGRIYIAAKGDLGYLVPDSNGIMTIHSLLNKVPKESMDCVDKLFDVKATKAGAVYVCDSAALEFSDENELIFYSMPGVIDAIARAKDGVLLVNSEKGLVQIRNKKLEVIPEGQDLQVRSMISTKDGRVIIATNGLGLLVYDEAKTTSDGKLSLFGKSATTSELRKLTISKMSIWNDTYLLLGTIKDGLYLVDPNGQVVFNFKAPNILPSNDIYGLLVDHEQNIWIGTDKGVTRIVDEKKQVDPNVDNFASLIREMSNSQENKVIFGGAFFQKYGGVQTIAASDLNFRELEFTQNNLRFVYSSNSLEDPGSVQYQTLLEGFDSNWTEWTSRNYREFTNLYWQNYTFKVKARKKNGALSPETEYRFAIIPPWHETYWFYGIQVTIMLLLFLTSAYFRGIGKYPKATKSVNGIFLSVLFSVIYTKIGLYSIVGTISSGIGFVKLIASGAMGVLLKPAEDFIESKMDKFALDHKTIHKVKKHTNKFSFFRRKKKDDEET